MHYLEIRERVRKMRRNPTLSEKALWQNLKGKKLFGFRFQIINSLGLRVLRIRNEELFNMPAVLEKIFAALNNP